MERDKPTPQEEALPTPLEVNFASIPEQLRFYPHFVVWNYATIDEEIKKPPLDPKTGKRASVRRPDTWGSFDDAQRAYETGQFAGIGIVLTSDMGIIGIDLDHCITDGQPTDEAQQIITALDSYTETSPSDTGIRILLEAKLPGAFRRRGNIEMYEDMRYLTLTGHKIADTPVDVKPRHRQLYGLYHRLFQIQENTGGGVGLRPSAEYSLVRSDETVLQKALAAKNGENFKRYYHGDTSLWEGAGARHHSQSEADFTLVLMLLYWTNKDPTQVDRLFRQSGLMRSKWDRPVKSNETYGERIIKDAWTKGNH
jgi:putative DNA primase/helicase